MKLRTRIIKRKIKKSTEIREWSNRLHLEKKLHYAERRSDGNQLETLWCVAVFVFECDSFSVRVY